jgi:acyl-coenzyme A thioesterase PaaI-like protein
MRAYHASHPSTLATSVRLRLRTASATLNLNVSYLWGLTIHSGTIAAQGRVVRLTRSAAFVEGVVTNRHGEVCTQAVATFAVNYPEET